MDTMQDVLLTESFAAAAVQAVGNECLVVVLRPWSNGEPPAGVLAPSEQAGVLDGEAVAQEMAEKKVVLFACTFETVEEHSSAQRIVPQFFVWEHAFILMTLLLPPGVRLSEEVNDAVMRRCDAMTALGVDEVLLDPKPEAASLRQIIEISHADWQLNVQRMKCTLELEPEAASAEQVAVLKDRHRRLLFENMPRALMPQFAALNHDLSETDHTVGSFRCLKRMETVSGNVLLVVGEKGVTRVIKVTRKDYVTTPTELECLYREFRFLSSVISHPNVVRCLEMLHSPSRIYLVFEYAGDQNLQQLLATLPGQRLCEAQTLHCFEEVARGLAHCHSKDVAHRALSLNHVVVRQDTDGDSYSCQLVDFFSAMIARGDSTSSTVCGDLPCIAPEMALGTHYVPRFADLWSLGIVLLEMGGGKGTLSCCLPYKPNHAGAAAVAASMLYYFQAEGSHAAALGYLGGVQNEEILQRLAHLLQPEPVQRTELRFLVTEG